MSRCDLAWASAGLAALAAGIVLLAGCSAEYEAQLEQKLHAASAPAAAPEGDSSAAVAESAPGDAQPQPPARSGKQPDVDASGPVGKTLLAPTNALDGVE